MKATQKLSDLGQSLWLDNITRNLLNSGLLQSYINELSVTGLTSNPTIFDHAIKNSTDYDAAIRNKLKEGKSGEGLFFELALELAAPLNDQHNAGGHVERFCQSRRSQPNRVGRWRRLRSGVGRVRQGRYRHQRPGRKAAGRRGHFVCQILERPHGGDRLQERRSSEGKLGTKRKRN
jgi:Transaldolase/Fructose-6-phosphate aldolase